MTDQWSKTWLSGPPLVATKIRVWPAKRAGSSAMRAWTWQAASQPTHKGRVSSGAGRMTPAAASAMIRAHVVARAKGVDQGMPYLAMAEAVLAPSPPVLVAVGGIALTVLVVRGLDSLLRGG